QCVGEAGDHYSINHDTSPTHDDCTEELCYNIITLSSEQAYREITYDENSYIEIPYDLGGELGIDLFFTRSPDFDTGNPGGAYYLDVNDDGSIAKMGIT
ncbi:MAG: hypothetical protein LIO40_05305, partial [Ruminococcus sp.]|nr:hypothetical protein [Ruminococcus sp.]